MRILSKKPDFLIPDTGIDAIEKVEIGGVRQSILIQSEKHGNPILLFLHGGPSMPIPGICCRGQDYVMVTNTKELIKHFTLVFWDQRGTGKSYHSTISKDTMNLAQFISDANEVVDHLLKRFNQEKLFLAAHSWGTVLGLHLVERYPEKIHSYIGLSQIISWTENDKLSLTWAKAEAKRRGNQKARQELESVGEPPFVESFKQWGILRKWQARFNSMFYSDETIKSPGLLGVSRIMIQSKEYSLMDMVNSLYKGFNLVYNLHFIEELSQFNFHRTTLTVDVPVTFIHGKKDVHVSGTLVEAYVNELDAKKGKQLIWIDKSSHVFHPDDTKIVERLLIEELKRVMPWK